MPDADPQPDLCPSEVWITVSDEYVRVGEDNDLNFASVPYQSRNREDFIAAE